jgi:hypothetical protein
VDDGMHVNAYVADTNGSASYSTIDQQRMQRIVSALDSGFSAFPLTDPVVIADVNNDRYFNSADTLLLAREINYLNGGLATNNRPEIPDIPSGIGPFTFTGADPLVDIPQNLTATAGGMVTVPVRLDTAQNLESVQLELAWNPGQLELVGVRRGSLTGDFQYFVTNQQAGSLLVDMSRLEQMQGGQGTLLELDFRVAVDANGVLDLDLQWARLNDTRLTLNPAPLFGLDPTDGRVLVAPADTRQTYNDEVVDAIVHSVATQPSASVSDFVIDFGARYNGFVATQISGSGRNWLQDLLRDGHSTAQSKDSRPVGKLKGSLENLRIEPLKKSALQMHL